MLLRLNTLLSSSSRKPNDPPPPLQQPPSPIFANTFSQKNKTASNKRNSDPNPPKKSKLNYKTICLLLKKKKGTGEWRGKRRLLGLEEECENVHIASFISCENEFLLV